MLIFCATFALHGLQDGGLTLDMYPDSSEGLFKIKKSVVILLQCTI